MVLRVSLLIEICRLVCDQRLLQQLLIDLLAASLHIGRADPGRVDHQLAAPTVSMSLCRRLAVSAQIDTLIVVAIAARLVPQRLAMVLRRLGHIGRHCVFGDLTSMCSLLRMCHLRLVPVQELVVLRVISKRITLLTKLVLPATPARYRLAQ